MSARQPTLPDKPLRYVPSTRPHSSAAPATILLRRFPQPHLAADPGFFNVLRLRQPSCFSRVHVRPPVDKPLSSGRPRKMRCANLPLPSPLGVPSIHLQPSYCPASTSSNTPRSALLHSPVLQSNHDESTAATATPAADFSIWQAPMFGRLRGIARARLLIGAPQMSRPV